MTSLLEKDAAGFLGAIGKAVTGLVGKAGDWGGKLMGNLGKGFTSIGSHAPGGTLHRVGQALGRGAASANVRNLVGAGIVGTGGILGGVAALGGFKSSPPKQISVMNPGGGIARNPGLP